MWHASLKWVDEACTDWKDLPTVCKKAGYCHVYKILSIYITFLFLKLKTSNLGYCSLSAIKVVYFLQASFNVTKA